MKIVERYPIPHRMLAGRGAWTLLLPLRWALAGVYGLWLDLFRARAGGDGRPPAKSPGAAAGRPVIVSIGNLEVGGGGKTPCAILIARALLARGGLAVVVTRGYRGLAEKHAPCVVPAGRPLSASGRGDFTTDEALLAGVPPGDEGLAVAARTLGDEVLLYRSRGIPVVVDPDRRRGTELARRLFAPTHVLLDDAFQNRALEKDVEILLLDAERPFDGERLLPLGTLRERAGAARRAGIVVFTRSSASRVPREAEPFVAGARVFFSRHEPRDLIVRGGAVAPLPRLTGLPCVLYSGIARPASFEGAAASLGARPRAAFRFADHHAYTPGDVREMLRAGGAAGAFLTTEKDWAKSVALFPREADVLALRIEMRVDGLDGLLDALASSSS